VTLTGTWSVGDSIVISAPALDAGCMSVSTAAVQIVTFTTN